MEYYQCAPLRTLLDRFHLYFCVCEYSCIADCNYHTWLWKGWSHETQ